MAARKKTTRKTAAKKRSRKPVNGLLAASRDKKYKAAKKKAVEYAKKAARAWKDAVKKTKTKKRK